MYYLYVKQHSITKLKYFGVTRKMDPFKYMGSGKYWLNHIKKHDKKYIITLDVWGFDHIEDCCLFADTFSYINDIVNSPKWANLISENGKDGNPKNYQITETTRKKLQSRTKEKNSFYGKHHTPEMRKYFSQIRKGKGRPHTEESKRKIGEKSRGRVQSEVVKQNLSDKIKERYATGAQKKPSGALNGYAKPVTINDVTYPYIGAACQALNLTRYQVSKLLI